MASGAHRAGTANVVEVFSSIQGEGPWVGTRTLFVRFGECDLRCAWCDSPGTWRPAEEARIEQAPGGAWQVEKNPLAIDRIVAACQELDLAAHRFVALTGGEPLLQPEAVAALAGALAGRGPRLYLETHGLAESALARVIDAIDVVSMDWKLASDVRRESDPRSGPVADFHDAHERFLRTAHAGAETYVKAVITPASRDEELLEMAARIARVDPALPVVLQPVTPIGRVRERPGAARMLSLASLLAQTLRDVRVIPQTHPVWQAR
ncbi:MAG: 7-carboxy-7-deazaguanine synthase QueE [Myxococcales bacterium]|nr:7-carboxy-7-deazaguanine synthase QueE [Myxococcales bacterium]